MELIQPVKVARDEMGEWHHPGIPDFEENHEFYKEWLAEQGLKTCSRTLDSEDMDHPVYQSYFEAEDPDPNFSAWEPTPPVGEGWFVLWIGDTEDGPYYVWARREDAQ